MQLHNYRHHGEEGKSRKICPFVGFYLVRGKVTRVLFHLSFLAAGKREPKNATHAKGGGGGFKYLTKFQICFLAGLFRVSALAPTLRDV